MPKEPAAKSDVKSPLQKSGWNLMLLGFFIVLLSGIAYYAAHRTGDPMLRKTGTVLWLSGLAVYVFGRIQRWRGRAKD
jgi:hypothetical protein